MTCHFVAPHTDRVPLGDGDWIDLKRELTIGDQKALESAALHDPIIINGTLYQPIDWGKYELIRVTVWITGWSLLDLQGQPAPIALDAVKALRPTSFAAINATIVARVTEASAKKKTDAGSTSATGSMIPPAGSSPMTATP